MATTIISASSPLFLLRPHLPKSLHQSQFPLKPASYNKKLHYFQSQKTLIPSSAYSSSGGGLIEEAEESESEKELVFFDGGSHYGDLVANLLLGFTLLWLPLTLAAISRAFFLRYRFTNRRATVVSGFTGGDRTDFPYSSVADVKVVPRLVGEWGDIVISLKDGTKVDLRSVPKFREIADYCLLMAEDDKTAGAGGTKRRGF